MHKKIQIEAIRVDGTTMRSLVANNKADNKDYVITLHTDTIGAFAQLHFLVAWQHQCKAYVADLFVTNKDGTRPEMVVLSDIFYAYIAGQVKKIFGITRLTRISSESLYNKQKETWNLFEPTEIATIPRASP